MTMFEDQIAAFELGLSFQDAYANEIKGFADETVRRLVHGEDLNDHQKSILLIDDPKRIQQTLYRWADAVRSTRERLRAKLANYDIAQAILDQRGWPKGQYRLIDDVINVERFTNNPLLRNPYEASMDSATAIKVAFPISTVDADPLNGQDRIFADELRRRGNPWAH